MCGCSRSKKALSPINFILMRGITTFAISISISIFFFSTAFVALAKRRPIFFFAAFTLSTRVLLAFLSLSSRLCRSGLFFSLSGKDSGRSQNARRLKKKKKKRRTGDI